MKKKWICLLTALTLIVGVCATGPMISGAEEAIRLEPESCSMKIYPENPKASLFQDDWGNADIVVDVYKVADAVKKPGYNTYTYAYTSNYTGLTLPPEKQEGRTAEFWQELAQSAVERALGLAGNKTADEPVREGEKMNGADGVAVSKLDPGLYLLIARSSKMETVADYKITMRSKTDKKVDKSIATIANSEAYTYIFSPQLISVPMRGEGSSLDVTGPKPKNENGPMPGTANGPGASNESETTVNPDITTEPDTTVGPNTPDETATADQNVYTTADSDHWVYDLNVYLKPIRVRRYGALEIEKNLLIYESEEDVPGETTKPAGQDENVTFVFQAAWTDPDTGKSETRVDSITFHGESERNKKVIVERIPVGTNGTTDVKVTEIYDGASYELVGETTRTQTIQVKAERIQNGVAILDDFGAVKTIIGDVADSGTPQRVLPKASFTNTYNGRQRKGYGINNKFVYDEEKGWLWMEDGEGPGVPVGTGTVGGPDGETGGQGEGTEETGQADTPVSMEPEP